MSTDRNLIIISVCVYSIQIKFEEILKSEGFGGTCDNVTKSTLSGTYYAFNSTVKMAEPRVTCQASTLLNLYCD